MSGDRRVNVDWDKVQGDLQQLRDEARVKLHLAGMDAKDAWSELEPQVNDFLAKAKEAGEQAGDDLSKLADKLQTQTKGWLEGLKSSK